MTLGLFSCPFLENTEGVLSRLNARGILPTQRAVFFFSKKIIMANERRQVSIFINGKEVENSIKNIAKEKRELQNVTAGLVGKAKEYNANVKEIARLDGILNEHKQAIKGVESAWYKNIPAVQGLIAASAGLFAVNSIIAYGKEALTVSSNIEQTTVAFQTMLGSKEKADKLQAELIQLANNTPFELKDVQEASKKLLAFGFSAQEVVPNLTALGNIAAGVGQEKLPQLILAFGQVKAATRLTGNELRQFTEAGVPLMDELAKNLKKPVSEIKKMVEAGEIGFPLVDKALKSLTTEGGRFANLMEAQSKTLGGLYSTFKDTFTQNVLLPIGDGLAKVIKPALGGLNDMAQSLGSLSPKMDALKKSTESESAQLAFLVEKATLYKKGSKEREQAINDIQRIYPDFLKNMNTEKVTNEELRGKLQEVNKQYQAKLLLIETNKVVEEYMNKETTAVKELSKSQAEYAKQLVKARDIAKYYGDDVDVLKGKLKTLSDNYKGYYANNDAQNYLQFLNLATKEQFNAELNLANVTQGKVNAKIQEKKINDELIKQHPELAQAFKDIEAALNASANSSNNSGTGAESAESEKAKHIREAKEKFYDDMKEKAKAFNIDLDKINTEGVEKEVLAIKKKYLSVFDAIQDFAKKYPSEQRKADLATKEFTELQNKEIREVYVKRFGDIEDELLKHQENIETLYQGEEEKEIAKINKKYAKQITLLKALEKDTTNATLAEREKAHTLLDQLEKLKAEEINKLKTKLLAEQTKKDIEANEKFFADMQRMRDELDAFLDKKPVKINLDSDASNLNEVIKNIEEIAAAEQKAITDSSKKLIKDQGDAADEIVKINNKKDALIVASNKKKEDDIAKANKAANARALNDQLEVAAQIGNAFVSLSDLVVGETMKNSDLQKAAALFQIGVDTAMAISSATAKGVKGDAITSAINIAATIAVVLANIVKARNVLNAAPIVKQKAKGGYADVIGKDDRQRYNARVTDSFDGGLVGSPTLLVGERGTEYVIPNYLLRNPIVANYTQIIEDMRTGGTSTTQQRADGGSVVTTTQPTNIVREQSSSTIEDNQSVLFLSKIYEALVSGKVMALVNTEGALAIADLIEKGKQLRDN
jgi:tape measure domain-containing protein